MFRYFAGPVTPVAAADQGRINMPPNDDITVPFYAIWRRNSLLAGPATMPQLPAKQKNSSARVPGRRIVLIFGRVISEITFDRDKLQKYSRRMTLINN